MGEAKRTGTRRDYPVKGGQYIAGNAVVMLAAGLAVGFASAAATDICAGVSNLGVDNTAGFDGETRIGVEVGEHKFLNSGDIANADVGADAFFVDERTLSMSSATNTRPKAGVITQIDDDGVWVSLGIK
ncbi:hypothetical protein [Photobacterium sp.]|uniref:hypothetical protein n=1 Tax=Photobacterium sp. TaxID=660 RepID=UPI00299F2FB3|nr:hypothetical protein [Photobacterium sp.]MDX1301193.1 hypothetical protein [Photobacterium sp.]